MDMGLIPSQEWDRAAFHHWLASFPNVGTGEYQDLVSMVLFLCSNAATSMTGLVIPVERGEQ